MSFCTLLVSMADREDDTVYFFGDTSQHSWAGAVDYNQSMSETDISRYIEKERPDLFQQLHGLRLGSSDIPLNCHGQRMLSKTAKVGKQACAEVEELRLHPSLSAFQIEGSSIPHSNGHSQAGASELKDYVLDKIRNGYILSLLYRKPNDISLMCASLACEYAFSRKHYLALHRFAMPDEPQHYHLDSLESSYCLHCIEEAFDFGMTSCEESQPVSSHPLGQGIERERVLQAAQRLHPSNEWHSHHIGTNVMDTEKSETSLLTIGHPVETQDEPFVASRPPADDTAKIHKTDAEVTASDLQDALDIVPWGIPVNKPSRSELVAIVCPEAEREIFGIAAPGYTRVDTRTAPESADILRRNGINASTFHFSDLAPFIHAVGLSHRGCELVEAWKNSRRESNLWTRMNRSGALDVFSPDCTELTQLERVAMSIRLSEILEEDIGDGIM